MTYISDILPTLLSGLKMTLGVFAITLIGSLPLGGLVALGLRSPFFALRWVLNGYVWIMRGTPMLLQLIFIYYGLGMIGLPLGRFESVAFAFILNYAAYFAEIFRGGFQAVAKGQMDAAQVLGFSRLQTLRKIILPQVFKIVLPSVGNEVINLIKDTSLVYVIGLGDLLRAGNIAAIRDVTLVPYALVGLIYLLLTAIATFGLRRIEGKYAQWR
ncbi:MAG TPA: amino acid ABC transporter permease [Lactobacillaceae bacterium]|jgi:polar amino acid transport system permease protein